MQIEAKIDGFHPHPHSQTIHRLQFVTNERQMWLIALISRRTKCAECVNRTVVSPQPIHKY